MRSLKIATNYRQPIDLVVLGKDLISHPYLIKNWQNLESATLDCCLLQNEKAYRNGDKTPDIVVPDILGLECKLIKDSGINDRINLNSTPPREDEEIYYVCAHVEKDDSFHLGEIIDLAIVHSRCYYSDDILQIEKNRIATKSAHNDLLKYRVRLMYEIESPFKIWGRGFYVVDKKSRKSRIF